MTRKPSIRALIAVLASGTLLLSGCASDNDDETPTPDPAPVETTTDMAPEPSDMAPEPSESQAAPAPSESTEPEAAPAPSEEEATEEIVITIVDFAYEIPETIAPGATITVINEDSAAHTVTSSPAGAFDVNVPGGQSATFTAPSEPGEYNIVCIFHGNMTDTLVVG